MQGAAQPSDRVLSLSVIGASCDGSTPSSQIDRIEIEEDPSSITITVWVRTSLPRFGACTDVGILLADSVQLSEPVGDRRLIDGSLP